MRYKFSLPTKAATVPTGPDWLHEIKYDGHRMMVIREGDRMRLISRGGLDWARRFPDDRRGCAEVAAAELRD
jgi:bifunctional non-homologous end joining protein LigD